jgi:hypothetical protein
VSGGKAHAFSRFTLACLAATLLNAASAAAREVVVAGIPVAEQATVASQRLLLNGVGVRTMLGFRVYVASLYLPSPMRDTARILDKDTAKSLQVTLLRDTTTEQNLDALKDGMIDNNSPAELDAIQREIDLFFALIKQVHEVPTGTRIQLDYRPGEGTRLKIGNRELGVIPGERFSRAVLKIWLGGDPIQLSLKHSLLGIESSAL